VTRRRTVLAVLTAVAAVLVTGCTGIPNESQPQVVATLPAAEQPLNEQIAPPAPGESPRAIVKGFLDANLSTDAEHTIAKAYLTPEARSTWSTSTSNVSVVDGIRVGTLSGDQINVTVDEVVGSVDSVGEYTPNLDVTQSAATKVFGFRLSQVDSQWRISELPPGLIIDRDDFIPNYRRTLYFFDSTNSYLVPDVRYTALAAQSLSTWLLDQLIAGPRPELSDIAHNAMPQIDARNVRATLSASRELTINLPGSSHFDPNRLRHLAAQLAFTYDSAEQAAAIRITDGSTVVTLPNGLTTFTTDDFQSFSSTPQVSPTAYYLRGGLVFAGPAARPVSGPFGDSRYPLESVAVRQSGDDIAVAGVRSDNGYLAIGGLRGRPTQIRLPSGATSRPDWNRVSGRLWIGVGRRLYTVDGQRLARIPFVEPTVAFPPGGLQIRSVRVSPDGSRVALVIAQGDVSTLWVGGIDTTSSGPQVTGLRPVTRTDLTVRDAGWSDGSTLVYIGTSANGRLGVWTVLVDGSNAAAVGTSNLPGGAPTAIAVTPGVFPVIAVGAPPSASSLWQETTTGSGDWAAFEGTAQPGGYAPTFATA
jgi:Lipoprotein LpqB beta-propeller domain